MIRTLEWVVSFGEQKVDLLKGGSYVKRVLGERMLAAAVVYIVTVLGGKGHEKAYLLGYVVAVCVAFQES